MDFLFDCLAIAIWRMPNRIRRRCGSESEPISLLYAVIL
jgi:hypothetical protein